MDLQPDFGSLLFAVMFVVVAGIFAWTAFGAIDRLGQSTSEEHGLLVKKWVRWTGSWDLNLQPVSHYWGKVSVGGQVFTVRLYEGDFQDIHLGDPVIATTVVGRSGTKYALKARPNK